MKKFSVGYYLKNDPLMKSKIMDAHSLESVENSIKLIPNFERIEYILIKY